MDPGAHDHARGRLLASVVPRVTSIYVLRSYVARSTMGCMRTHPDVFDSGTPSSRRRSNDPPFLILMSLAGGAKHGHALLKDIEEFARVKLGPGALYGAITRLEERGLIKPLESDDRRRPYQITATGSEVLADSVAQMRELVRVGQARLKMARTPRPRLA
jgi:DNA-binding PadR family transcriptional regulator